MAITKEQFLDRIRQSLGRQGAPTDVPTPPAVDDALVRLTAADADLPATFTKNAEAVGMIVRSTTAAELITTITSTLTELNASSVTLSAARLEQGGAIREAIEQAGATVGDWQNDTSMGAHFDGDASITDVHAALAETGTLICNSDAQHGRGASLAVPTHIAVVRRSDILPDMLDYMATIQGKSPADLPSAQALITGPSKTADIEGILVTGVHGPGKVIILLVADA